MAALHFPHEDPGLGRLSGLPKVTLQLRGAERM